MNSARLSEIDESLFPHHRPGVIAGKAAGMDVVAVPSIPKQANLYSSADEVINSLLDLQPEKWGLPSFDDCTPLSSAIAHFNPTLLPSLGL